MKRITLRFSGQYSGDIYYLNMCFLRDVPFKVVSKGISFVKTVMFVRKNCQENQGIPAKFVSPENYVFARKQQITRNTFRHFIPQKHVPKFYSSKPKVQPVWEMGASADASTFRQKFPISEKYDSLFQKSCQEMEYPNNIKISELAARISTIL